MPAFPPLPPSVLVALGLTACAPRPVPQAASAERGSAERSDTGPLAGTAETGAPETADTATTTAGTGDTAQEEPQHTSDTGLDGTADTGTYKACLCGCDSLEGSIGLNLVLPGLAVLAYRRRSRREILSLLTDSGVLPPDVAARLAAPGER